MKRSRWRATVVAIAVLVVMSLVSTSVAHAEGYGDDTLLAVVPDTVWGLIDAESEGRWVVWSQDQSPSDPSIDERDVYAMNLDTDSVIAVASGPEDQGAFITLDNSVVVWTEAACSTCFRQRIRARDLERGIDITLAKTSTQSDIGSPVISGRWVTWTERTDDFEHLLLARDIHAMTPSIIIARGFEEPIEGTRSTSRPLGHYDVSGDIVVWLERVIPGGQPTQLVSRNLVTGETKILANPAQRMFDLHGTTVVHHKDVRESGGGEHVIMLIDVLTGVHWSVSPKSPRAGWESIETDGRFILWATRSGQTAGYDLYLNASFLLPVDWWSFDLDSGNLRWFDYRSWVGDSEIHEAPAEEFSSGMRSRHFPETDHWLSLVFLKFWERNGGLGVFGYPLAGQMWEDGDNGVRIDTQWLERQRLEWHRMNVGTPYEVLLGRLGAELLEQQGRDWTTFETAVPATPHYMAETGHAVAPEFWDYWSTHGLDLSDAGVSFRESLALFGYPLSEPMMETNADGDTVLTQYFERAVFEWHPDNPEPYRVLLRRLGAEMLPAEE